MGSNMTYDIQKFIVLFESGLETISCFLELHFFPSLHAFPTRSHSMCLQKAYNGAIWGIMRGAIITILKS